MIKLIKFTIFLFSTVVAGYLLLGISFGEKTLYEHILKISKTDEAQTLKDEIGKKMDLATHNIKDKAKKLAIDKVKEKLDTITTQKKEADKAPKPEEISDNDKQKLQSLIQKKSHATAHHTDRTSLDQLIHQKIQESP